MLYHHPAALWLGLAAGLVQGASLNKRAAIDDCLAAAKVPTDKPGSDDWKADTLPFNDRIHFTPAAVAVPTNIEQIQAAVKCAAQTGDVKVTPKSGGHSYASLGLGGEDGHLVVQLDRMFNVSLNTETNIATVQPGARLGHVATELWNQGKRAISAGTCPGVGVSGHALHGGFGMSSHKYGLATDWIVGMQVVLADGGLVRASATENAELFWGLKGAGSNFGIVASYEFDTFAAPDEVTYFSMPFRWNATTAGPNLAALEAYARDTMPADLNMRMFTSGFSSQLEGMFFGDAAGLRAALAPLLNATTPALRIAQAVSTTWMDAFAHYANAPTDPTHPYETQETFYSKSLTLKSLEGEAGANFVDYWFGHTQANRRSWWLQLDVHGGKNSAVSHGPRTNTSSYAHRDSLWLIQFYDRVYAGAYPATGFGFLDGWVANVTRPLARADWGMYINYADSRLSRDDAMQNYWGANLGRLQALKADVDKDQRFYYPQAFPPAAAA